MNEEKARGYLDSWNQYKKVAPPGEYKNQRPNPFAYAMGYLKALGRAKGLEDTLRRIPCKCHPPSEFMCIRCEALTKWEKKK